MDKSEKSLRKFQNPSRKSEQPHREFEQPIPKSEQYLPKSNQSVPKPNQSRRKSTLRKICQYIPLREYLLIRRKRSSQYKSTKYGDHVRQKEAGFWKRLYNNKRRKRFFIRSRRKIDYKNLALISRFIGYQARIIPRRVTKVTLRHQRLMTRAIKRARFLGFLPFQENERHAMLVRLIKRRILELRRLKKEEREKEFKKRLKKTTRVRVRGKKEDPGQRIRVQGRGGLETPPLRPIPKGNPLRPIPKGNPLRPIPKGNPLRPIPKDPPPPTDTNTDTDTNTKRETPKGNPSPKWRQENPKAPPPGPSS